MTRRTFTLTVEGDIEAVMPSVMEEVAAQIVEGRRSGSIDVMDGVDWSLKDVPEPAHIDIRQRRAAALLLLAVGTPPTLTALAGSVQEATAICPGLTAVDLPPMTEEGRLEALCKARSLIDEMIAGSDIMMRNDPDLRVPHDYSPDRDGNTAFHFADEDCYPCFPMGSTWNGFDNVSVSAQVRDLIVARWRSAKSFDEETVEDLAAIEPGPDGRICLGWGYATTVDGTIAGR